MGAIEAIHLLAVLHTVGLYERDVVKARGVHAVLGEGVASELLGEL